MKTKTKTFDCVEMKNRIQRELMAEYEARKDKFSSYVDFINATADASEEIRAWRKKITKPVAAAKH